MVVDRSALESSLKSVCEAYRVLEAFHREIVAFFNAVDEQLSIGSHGCELTAHDAGNVVFSGTTALKRYEEWVPRSLGHLYYDDRLQVGDDEEETVDSRAAAVVSVFSTVGDDMPECWFGLGRPGQGTRYTDSWNFGRNGLWNFTVNKPPERGWSRGTFPENAYGKGGIWSYSRVPLVEVASADDIRELVAHPLLEEWNRAIRSAPAH